MGRDGNTKGRRKTPPDYWILTDCADQETPGLRDFRDSPGVRMTLRSTKSVGTANTRDRRFTGGTPAIDQSTGSAGTGRRSAIDWVRLCARLPPASSHSRRSAGSPRLAVGPVGSRPRRPLNPLRRPARPVLTCVSAGGSRRRGGRHRWRAGDAGDARPGRGAADRQAGRTGLRDPAAAARRSHLRPAVRRGGEAARRHRRRADRAGGDRQGRRRGRREDVQKFVAANRRRLPADPATILPQIKAYLNNERTKARHEAFADELRRRRTCKCC